MSDVLEQLNELRKELANERARLLCRVAEIDLAIGPITPRTGRRGRPSGSNADAARSFMRTHPGSSARQITDATGYHAGLLSRMRKEGRARSEDVGGILRWYLVDKVPSGRTESVHTDGATGMALLHSRDQVRAG
jgi:hypothetical protein